MKGTSSGFNIGSSSLEVTLLQYADDVLIFCPFSAQMMENWWGLIIHVFLLASGLSLNFSKNTVIGVNCSRSKVSFWCLLLDAKYFLLLSKGDVANLVMWSWSTLPHK